MALQKTISRARNRALLGGRYRMLITGPSAETDLLWEGRLETQAEEIDGKTFLTDFGDTAPKPGSFGLVRITRATDYDLFGVLESVEPQRAVNSRSAGTSSFATGNSPVAPAALLPILQ
jgi:tRNA A37 methylthiotransferase MiaB